MGINLSGAGGGSSGISVSDGKGNKYEDIEELSFEWETANPTEGLAAIKQPGARVAELEHISGDEYVLPTDYQEDCPVCLDMDNRRAWVMVNAGPETTALSSLEIDSGFNLTNIRRTELYTPSGDNILYESESAPRLSPDGNIMFASGQRLVAIDVSDPDNVSIVDEDKDTVGYSLNTMAVHDVGDGILHLTGVEFNGGSMGRARFDTNTMEFTRVSRGAWLDLAGYPYQQNVCSYGDNVYVDSSNYKYYYVFGNGESVFEPDKSLLGVSELPAHAADQTPSTHTVFDESNGMRANLYMGYPRSLFFTIAIPSRNQ